MDILTGEGKLGDGLDDNVGRTGCGVADLDTGSEQSKVDELASVDRKIFDLLLINDGTDHGARGLCDFADVLNGNFLRYLSYGEIEVQVRGCTDVQMYFLGALLKPGLLGSDGVIARRQQSD